MTATSQLKCWNSMHIHNNSVICADLYTCIYVYPEILAATIN